jgi:hypothetical protein
VEFFERVENVLKDETKKEIAVWLWLRSLFVDHKRLAVANSAEPFLNQQRQHIASWLR